MFPASGGAKKMAAAEMPKKLFIPQPNHTLAAVRIRSGRHQLKYIPSIGVEAGFWWGSCSAIPVRLTHSAWYTILRHCKEEVAILGRPQALLQASATAPLADWFARLSDVAPDGTVTQITGAGLNGAQRESMIEPHDLEPGKTYPLNITMHLTSWVFPKGHRIRLAISNALWPMILPTPYTMTTSLELGGSQRFADCVARRPSYMALLLRHSDSRNPPKNAPTSQVKASPGRAIGRWNATRPSKTTVHWTAKTASQVSVGKRKRL